MIRIADSEPQELRLEAATDVPVLITLAARDVDIKAAVVSTNHAITMYADAPNRRMGMETLLVEPPHGEVMTLRIERNDHRDARGSVRVTAVGLPTGTPDDRRRLEAARLEATACLGFPDTTMTGDSAATFVAAARLHDKLDDRSGSGIALLHAAGARYTRDADWEQAAALASDALSRLDETDAPDLTAFAMRLLGAALAQHANTLGPDTHSGRRTVDRARKHLTEAASRFQSLGFAYEAGYALNYRGVSYLEAGEREQARVDFTQALDLFRSAHDPPAQALSLQSLALLSYEDGRLGDAIREFDQALALIPREQEPGNYAHTLHNSALPLRVLGRFDEAMERYLEAGNILRSLGDRDGEARALHGLGTTLGYAGEPERAADLLRSAIRLRGETGARREQAVSMFVLGQIEREAGRISSAVALHQEALTLVSAPHDNAQARLALARDYLTLGSLSAAWTELNAILELNLPKTHRYLGLALTEIGTLKAQERDHQGAEEAFARAIAIHKANDSELELAQTLRQRAEARLRAGDVQAALDDSAIALQMFDTIGLRGTRVESRASFRASYRDVIELRITAFLLEARSAQIRGDVERTQQLFASAFEMSDRSRAQFLFESWTSWPDSGDAPAEILRQREETYELLAGKRQQREQLLEAAQPDTERVAGLTRQISMLRTQAALIESRLAQARETTGKPVASVGGNLVDSLPPEIVVAEYFLGNAHSWLFRIHKRAITVQELPGKPEIERLARQLHVSWRATTRPQGDRYAAGQELAEILFRPLGTAAPVGGLQIVPDGALHLVPTAVLARRWWPELRPGAATVIPSLTAVRAANLRGDAPPDLALAVVADPIYSADDSRIRRPGIRVAPVRDTTLSRGDLEPRSLKRLVSAAVEARELIALVDDPAGTLALIGSDANRTRVIGSQLGRFRIVHFATHALADSQDAALATLVLSRWSADGERIDGDLRSFDIARVRFNADLVVLSGCDTALGREIAGEGPLGLSQAFLRSGARSVVATLWQVPDSSTAALMREFYLQLLGHRRDAAVALQLAQDAVRQQAKWSDPYYWAGFQLISVAPIRSFNNNV